MTKQTDPTRDASHETIEKLRQMLEKREIDIFDTREVETIRRMIDTYESFESFGRLSNGVRSVVIWLGVMIAAYFAFTEWFVKFIRIKAGGP